MRRPPRAWISLSPYGGVRAGGPQAATQRAPGVMIAVDLSPFLIFLADRFSLSVLPAGFLAVFFFGDLSDTLSPLWCGVGIARRGAGTPEV